MTLVAVVKVGVAAESGEDLGLVSSGGDLSTAAATCWATAGMEGGLVSAASANVSGLCVASVLVERKRAEGPAWNESTVNRTSARCLMVVILQVGGSDDQASGILV